MAILIVQDKVNILREVVKIFCEGVKIIYEKIPTLLNYSRSSTDSLAREYISLDIRLAATPISKKKISSKKTCFCRRVKRIIKQLKKWKRLKKMLQIFIFTCWNLGLYGISRIREPHP